MNKSVIESLIKIASSLDSIGLVKEANVVDRIAQELSPGNNVASMDYKTDIEKYKSFLQSGNLDAANILKDNVISSYDEKSKLAFLAQALRIENQTYHKNAKEDSYTDDQLYNLLINYGIYNAQDLKTLNSSWNKMMSNLENKNLLTDNKKKILRQTYRNVAAKFGYSKFNSNTTGNIDTDSDMYERLLTNRLFSEASGLLSQVLSSDKYSPKQKEIFKLRADSKFIALETQSNTTLSLGGVNNAHVIETANNFGVYKARNINEFNAAWNKVLNYYKTNKFDIDKKNPQAPTVYDSPGTAYQLENFRKEIMIQKGFTKLPSS